MNDDKDKQTQDALFRLSVLGDLVHRELERGELKELLRQKAQQRWVHPDGEVWAIKAKTLEGWYYDYDKNGIEGLYRAPRSDKGSCKAIAPELQELILDMKREDPGRSVPLIMQELVDAGRMQEGDFSASSVLRLLRRHGLSKPRLALDRRARYRWQASVCGALWQGDCCHGPKLFDPASGREVRAKIFALIDDRSRLVTHIWAFFVETQVAFLTLLLRAVLSRGVPRAIYLDNHGSFTGSDVRLACAHLRTQLLFAPPYDGSAKGKIERLWRSLRARVLDRLDMRRVETLDDLNLRLQTWMHEYNERPHGSLGGQSPLEVWEQDADQIRWVEDEQRLEQAFLGQLTRRVRGDSTVQVNGHAYEVPSHLRGTRVPIHYSLFRPEILWIEDGDTQVILREVDPEDNADRPRIVVGPQPPGPTTGSNYVEGLVRRRLHAPGADHQEAADA